MSKRDVILPAVGGGVGAAASFVPGVTLDAAIADNNVGSGLGRWWNTMLNSGDHPTTPLAEGIDHFVPFLGYAGGVGGFLLALSAFRNVGPLYKATALWDKALRVGIGAVMLATAFDLYAVFHNDSPPVAGAINDNLLAYDKGLRSDLGQVGEFLAPKIALAGGGATLGAVAASVLHGRSKPSEAKLG